ncbi:hypothetical protein Aph01nite_48340 [Acrocarpospora phusangensis]|uniref:Uncharacterized protein n=1 Tax=Acrocarpospora phusangensis TaxID=1070424 RepID=A0A919UM11_9ACTN|nr:hypothetical protein Aph01nite_48340 [Acrocarpospora phusangensis]
MVRFRRHATGAFPFPPRIPVPSRIAEAISGHYSDMARSGRATAGTLPVRTATAVTITGTAADSGLTRSVTSEVTRTDPIG